MKKKKKYENVHIEEIFDFLDNQPMKVDLLLLYNKILIKMEGFNTIVYTVDKLKYDIIKN